MSRAGGADQAGPVLITGCSTGIGRATASHLAGLGLTVFATARRPDTLTDIAHAGCRTLALDVTDEDSMRAAVATIEAEHGRVGALVNNAGYSQSGPVEEITSASLRRQFDTNVFGAVRLCQFVLPAMRAAGRGRIVNLSSMGGRMTLPGGGAYHATKYALEAFSDALRYETKGFGVHVVLVEPGPVNTEFGTTATASTADQPTDGPYAAFMQGVDALVARTYAKPPKGSARPEAIAEVIASAITSRRPKTRYLVGPTAKSIVTTHSLLSDRLWDRFLATQYPEPPRASPSRGVGLPASPG
ncbi:MAG: SDR family NAD(P)-dependent oxidoreductase [Acidimicrobiia bacterium]|nr:SDR family NAD(P)-dependent oxidoreductase [Acidimicrobiia bacterium]